MKEIAIRPATPADFDAMWAVHEELIASGDTMYFPADITREACLAYWFGPDVASHVAVLNGERLLGMYRLVPAQPGRGAHVASAFFVVSPAAQGIGVGKLLGADCLRAARQAGYLAMQLDFVISSNVAAVLLWKRLGFQVAGTLAGAYRHPQLGYVDAYLMYQLLNDRAHWPE